METCVFSTRDAARRSRVTPDILANTSAITTIALITGFITVVVVLESAFVVVLIKGFITAIVVVLDNVVGVVCEVEKISKFTEFIACHARECVKSC